MQPDLYATTELFFTALQSDQPPAVLTDIAERLRGVAKSTERKGPPLSVAFVLAELALRIAKYRGWDDGEPDALQVRRLESEAIFEYLVRHMRVYGHE